MAKQVSTEQESVKKPRRRWKIIAAVIILLLMAGGGAFFLYTRYQSTEGKLQQAVDTYVHALMTGDLSTLQNVTCGELNEYYNSFSQQDFQKIHDDLEKQKKLPLVGDVHSSSITGNTAIVQVPVTTEDRPGETSDRTIDLQKINNTWKVCNPASEGSP